MRAYEDDAPGPDDVTRDIKPIQMELGDETEGLEFDEGVLRWRGHSALGSHLLKLWVFGVLAGAGWLVYSGELFSLFLTGSGFEAFWPFMSVLLGLFVLVGPPGRGLAHIALGQAQRVFELDVDAGVVRVADEWLYGLVSWGERVDSRPGSLLEVRAGEPGMVLRFAEEVWGFQISRERAWELGRRLAEAAEVGQPALLEWMSETGVEDVEETAATQTPETDTEEKHEEDEAPGFWRGAWGEGWAPFWSGTAFVGKLYLLTFVGGWASGAIWALTSGAQLPAGGLAILETMHLWWTAAWPMVNEQPMLVMACGVPMTLPAGYVVEYWGRHSRRLPLPR